MNMGERLFALGPALAGAPELGENARLHWPVVGRREKCHDARLVAKREAGEAACVLRHPGKHRSGAPHEALDGASSTIAAPLLA